MPDQHLKPKSPITIVLDDPIAELTTRAEKEDYVLGLANDAGEDGVTVHEVHRLTGMLVQTVSGILSRLKSRGELVEQRFSEEVAGEEVVYKFARMSPTGGKCAVLVTPVNRGHWPGRVEKGDA